MKKIIATVALCAGSLLAVNAQAALNEAEILQKIEALQQQVASQQQVINELKKEVSAKKETVPAGASKIQLANSAIDQLKIKGDLRVRFEKRQIDNDNADDKNRDRLRTRFRVGGIWQNTDESYEIGAGLATGITEATSTNATWSESSPFETGDIRLDYAYGKHKWNDMTFTAGQHLNPYQTSWIFWDSDVRFAGFTGGYESDMGLFATAGAYGVRYYKASDDDYNTAMLYAGQVGYKGKAKDLPFTLAVGYYTYDQSFINEEQANGGLLQYVDPDQYGLNIGDLYGDVHFPLSAAKMKLYGQVWQNFGADGSIGQSQQGDSLNPEDEDMGWVLGLEAKINKFKLGYAYTCIEADSLYGYLKDADFGTGLNNTDIKGHRIDFGYNFTKNVSFGVTAMLYEAIELDNEPDVDLYQVDLVYKF
jgi:hypothetical protein